MDIRTLLFADLVLQICCAAGLLLMSRGVPGLRGLRWFAWAYGSGTAGILLVIVGPRLPIEFHAMAAPSLILLGAFLVDRGIVEFTDGWAGWTGWGWGLLGISCAATVYCTLARDWPVARAEVFCLSFAALLGWGVAVLLRHRAPGERGASLAAAAMLGGIACLGLARAIAAVWFTRIPLDLLDYNPVRFAGLVGFMVFNAGLAFSLVWMVTARLRGQLESEVRTDGLTGALNRRALEVAAEREIAVCRRRGGALAVLAIDLDHFKGLNDTFGHAAGDAALLAVARLLQNGLRRADLIARFGGEEFIAVLPEMNLTTALEVAERLRRQLEELRVPFERRQLRLTASFGVAALLGETDTWAALLRRADTALYAAKQAGRNCVLAEASPRAHTSIRAVIEMLR